MPMQLKIFKNKITANKQEPHVAREADTEISEKLLIQPLRTKMNCFDEWEFFNELPYDMPVIFSMSSRESFCLSFVWPLLFQNNGRSRLRRQRVLLWFWRYKGAPTLKPRGRGRGRQGPPQSSSVWLNLAISTLGGWHVDTDGVRCYPRSTHGWGVSSLRNSGL